MNVSRGTIPTREVGFDAAMIRHASRRGTVMVARDGQPPRTAILVSWRPADPIGRRAYRARVEFTNGSRCTVNAANVSPVDLPEMNELTGGAE